MERVRIREAEVGDAAALARVHVDSWRTTYAGMVSDDYLAQLSYEAREARWRAILQRDSPAEHNLVAETRSGQVVGFASGGPEREGNPTFKGELYAIYLLQAAQGQGIGRQLAAAVAQRLKADGFDTMLVWVLAENPARRFYEALGGAKVAEKPIAIGDETLLEVAYGWETLEKLLA